MNDYLIFGASGLTGNDFLKEVKDKGASYHLFVRSLIAHEEDHNQTIFCQENIAKLPRSKNLIICLGYPLAFQELIWMNEETKRAFKEVDLNWKDYVTTDKRYYRPNEVEHLLGDPSKAMEKLNWKPKTSFEGLVDLMIESDLNLAKREQILLNEGLIKPTWESLN